MKKLFGSKAKAVTPVAGAYEDLTGAGSQQQQQQHHPDAFVQTTTQQQQQRAMAGDPTSPVTAEYIRHQHSRQDQERTIRKQQQQYRDPPAAVGYGAADENWEFIHNPALQRDDSAGGALPNPHPPVIPSSRTSSLGSLPLLPPGASPAVPAPLTSPLPESVYTKQGPVSPSTMPFNMLRKKPPSKEPPPQSNGMGGAAASILRALEPRIPSHEKTTRSRKGSADSEIGHDSNHAHHLDLSDVERERDSREFEMEREWRERDREIHATEELRRVETRDVDRERERESRQKQTTVRDRERERDNKERDRLHIDTRDPRRRKDSSRERSRSKEREGKEDKKSQWASLFSKDARHDKEREEHEAEQLSRMIGASLYFVSSFDTLIHVLCRLFDSPTKHRLVNGS